MKTKTKEKVRKSRGQLIRPELNIEKWQIFTTSQYRGKSRILERNDSKVIIGRIKNTGKEKGFEEVGILRTSELKCYYALIRLWEDADRPPKSNVTFSVYELADILNMSWSGRTFEMIEERLDRLKKIPIDWINAYYQRDIDITESVLRSFTILSDLTIYKRSESGYLSSAVSSFKFHGRVLRNLLEQNTKPLDMKTLLSFKKEISLLLYRHIDLVMADKNEYQRNSEGLIEKELQLEGSRYKYPSRRKQVLEPALIELEGVKLSTGVLTYCKLEKTKDDSDWKAVFKKKPFQKGKAHSRTKRKKPSWEIQALVKDILSVTGDEHSTQFYTKVAHRCPENMIYRALGEVKEEAREGRIRDTNGAAFTDKIKRYCVKAGIDLGLKTSQ